MRNKEIIMAEINAMYKIYDEIYFSSYNPNHILIKNALSKIEEEIKTLATELKQAS